MAQSPPASPIEVIEAALRKNVKDFMAPVVPQSTQSQPQFGTAEELQLWMQQEAMRLKQSSLEKIFAVADASQNTTLDAGVLESYTATLYLSMALCSTLSLCHSVTLYSVTLQHSVTLSILCSMLSFCTLSLCSTFYRCISLYVTLQHFLSLYITLCHSAALSITVYHSMSLCSTL